MALMCGRFTLPGKHARNYGTSLCLIGKSTISMAIFNSYVTNDQRVSRFGTVEIPVMDGLGMHPSICIGGWTIWSHVHLWELSLQSIHISTHAYSHSVIQSFSHSFIHSFIHWFMGTDVRIYIHILRKDITTPLLVVNATMVWSQNEWCLPLHHVFWFCFFMRGKGLPMNPFDDLFLPGLVNIQKTMENHLF